MSIDNIENVENVGSTRISLNDLKIPPRSIQSKPINFDETILNNFDISPELIEVNNYAVDLLIQLSSMIQIGYTFIQDSFFNSTSTQYTVIFTALCIIILISIFLFSKNKPKDIFIVIYFVIGFAILLAIKWALKFLMICIDRIKDLLNHFKTLWNRRDEVTSIDSFKDFFYFIYNFGGTFFAIIITLILLVISILIAGAFCIGVQLLFSLSKSVFNTIKGMSDSVEPVDTAQVVKVTFGTAFSESMERL